jgi:hypothetical protein
MRIQSVVEQGPGLNQDVVRGNERLAGLKDGLCSNVAAIRGIRGGVPDGRINEEAHGWFQRLVRVE